MILYISYYLLQLTSRDTFMLLCMYFTVEKWFAYDYKITACLLLTYCVFLCWVQEVQTCIFGFWYSVVDKNWFMKKKLMGYLILVMLFLISSNFLYYVFHCFSLCDAFHVHSWMLWNMKKLSDLVFGILRLFDHLKNPTHWVYGFSSIRSCSWWIWLKGRGCCSSGCWNWKFLCILISHVCSGILSCFCRCWPLLPSFLRWSCSQRIVTGNRNMHFLRSQ